MRSFFVTLLITFLVKLVSELMNLKAAAAGLPAEFIGVFDEEAYRKSRDYLQHYNPLFIIQCCCGSVCSSSLLVFWRI